MATGRYAAMQKTDEIDERSISACWRFGSPISRAQRGASRGTLRGGPRGASRGARRGALRCGPRGASRGARRGALRGASHGAVKISRPLHRSELSGTPHVSNNPVLFLI